MLQWLPRKSMHTEQYIATAHLLLKNKTEILPISLAMLDSAILFGDIHNSPFLEKCHTTALLGLVEWYFQH